MLQPIPGNGFCETGELPASSGGDCRPAFLCPTPSQVGHAAPCGRVGACDRSIGACICAPGYTGVDCGSCEHSSGYVPVVVQPSSSDESSASPSAGNNTSDVKAVPGHGRTLPFGGGHGLKPGGYFLSLPGKQSRRVLDSDVDQVVMCSLVLSEVTSRMPPPSSSSFNSSLPPPPDVLDGSEASNGEDDGVSLSWSKLKWYVAAGICGALIVVSFLGLLWILNILRSVMLGGGARVRPYEQLQLPSGYRNARVAPDSSAGHRSSHGSPRGNAVVEHLNGGSGDGSGLLGSSTLGSLGSVQGTHGNEHGGEIGGRMRNRRIERITPAIGMEQ